MKIELGNPKHITVNIYTSEVDMATVQELETKIQELAGNYKAYKAETADHIATLETEVKATVPDEDLSGIQSIIDDMKSANQQPVPLVPAPSTPSPDQVQATTNASAVSGSPVVAPANPTENPGNVAPPALNTNPLGIQPSSLHG